MQQALLEHLCNMSQLFPDHSQFTNFSLYHYITPLMAHPCGTWVQILSMLNISEEPEIRFPLYNVNVL